MTEGSSHLQPAPSALFPALELDLSSPALALAAQIPSTDDQATLKSIHNNQQPLSHFPLSNELYPNLSKFEVLLTIYTPILECLTNHLNTFDKLRLTHVSPHLRRLCHSYPSFWAHPDFHLVVREGGGYDTYGIGKVYNLDALLSILPFEGRLVSLNVDWTAITGHYLFKLVDKCAATLQHLSVRGCRKVSIKHHIVPHFVHQHLIEPYTISSSPELAGTGSGGWEKRRERPNRALRSLHAWKARGVRRKPFLIDRKEADGDEPTRYLTTLAAALGIFVDVGLCSTPKLRCPRRREITRRIREKYCVPFDRRWRETNTAVTELVPSLLKRGLGRDINCDNCGDQIGERCEACAVAMHCSNCAKTLCHACSWNLPFSSGNSSSGSSTSSGDGTAGGLHPNIDIDGDADPTAAGLIPAMRPCCLDTLPYNLLISSRSGDVYCEECYDNLAWGRCDACGRQMCKKHEWERRKICGGGCGRSFCFPLIGGGVGTGANAGPMGAGVVGCDMGGVRQCVGCTTFVCRACRTRTGCPCQLCTISFYCRGCWGSKPFSCDGDLIKRKAAAQLAQHVEGNSNQLDENIPLLGSASSNVPQTGSSSLSGPSHAGGAVPGPSNSQALQTSISTLWIGSSAGGNGQQSAVNDDEQDEEAEAEDDGHGLDVLEEDDEGALDEGDDELDEEEEENEDEEEEEEDRDEGEDEAEEEDVDVLPEQDGVQLGSEVDQQHYTGAEQNQVRGAGTPNNDHSQDTAEQVSLLVLDDEEGLLVNSSSLRPITSGLQSPVATTPLTPSHSRPGSIAGSGARTPTEDLLDPIGNNGEWLSVGPSLL
ncbi:hypothetical protein EV426DRAFT_702824 [Tirmania nivea]|nr:hypothetical protein EV426DRAFT_702824 [Tirmania nivea]